MLNISNRTIEKEIEESQYYSLDVVTTPRSKRVLTRWILAIFGVLFIALFLPWRQNIRGTGMLTAYKPQQRPQTLQSTIPGRIQKWHVQEGQLVKRGDTILTISEIKEKYFDPNILFRQKDQIESKESSIESNLEKAEALRNQVAILKEARVFAIDKAKNKLQQAKLKLYSDSTDYVAAKQANEVAQYQYKRMVNLHNQGLTSLTKLEDRRVKAQQTTAKEISALNKYLAAQNELLNARIQLNSVSAEYGDKIFKAESNLSATLAYVADARAYLAKLRVEYANIEVRQGYYILRAPQDGYVVNAIKTGIGENVKAGEPIASIMPESPELAVELYIKPMDLPLIKEGNEVRLIFDGWPAIVFSGWPGASVGTFGGRIKVVDYINSKSGKYRILVTPKEDDEPWPDALRVGSGVYGWAMLKNVPVWYEIWRQLNGFPPDMIKNLNNDESDKSNNEKPDGIKRKAK